MPEYVTPEYQAQLDRLAETLCTPVEAPVVPEVPTVYFQAGRSAIAGCRGEVAEMAKCWENEKAFEASLRAGLTPDPN